MLIRVNKAELCDQKRAWQALEMCVRKALASLFTSTRTSTGPTKWKVPNLHSCLYLLQLEHKNSYKKTYMHFPLIFDPKWLSAPRALRNNNGRDRGWRQASAFAGCNRGPWHINQIDSAEVEERERKKGWRKVERTSLSFRQICPLAPSKLGIKRTSAHGVHLCWYLKVRCGFLAFDLGGDASDESFSPSLSIIRCTTRICD